MTQEVIFEFASDISGINLCQWCLSLVNQIMTLLGGSSVRIEYNKLIITRGS